FSGCSRSTRSRLAQLRSVWKIWVVEIVTPNPMPSGSDPPTATESPTDPARSRHMADVLKAFGPIQAIASYVGPDWGTVTEPDLFDRPTRNDEIVRRLEQRIQADGLLYWRARE